MNQGLVRGKHVICRVREDGPEIIELFKVLHRDFNHLERAKIQLAPANIHWYSDEAPEQLQATASEFGVPLHMHLLETHRQREYVKRRGGGSAIDFLASKKLLGPQMTLGHGTWVSRDDMEQLAASGTHICHNCSSNLCMGNGVMPLNSYRRHGVRLAIGIDGAGINDDRDMLQELRLVHNIHKMPGAEPGDIAQPHHVFQMATENGANTTPYAGHLGKLEVSMLADLVIIDGPALRFPYLDREMPILDAIVHRGRTAQVKSVMVGGRLVLHQGQYARINKQAALTAFSESLKARPTPDDLALRQCFQQAVPYVREYFRDYGRVNRGASRDWLL